MTTRIGAALATVILFFATAAAAQEPPVAEAAALSPDAVFVFNTLLFLMGGFLVMFMAAGFCMLEVGLVRSKNAATICVKNIALYSIAGLMYWLIGYNLMYGITEGEYIARLALSDFAFAHPSAEEEAAASVSKGADWFFQMVFVATAASIVSGTLAERIKLWPFLIFVALLTGLIYPIQGAWEWGGGWLDAKYGFADFAGSTLVHSTGGWAALAGALVVGARTGKYGPNGVNPLPGSSLPLATLGTFILWLGWFGFNGGSQLALGSVGDATAVARIFGNTNIAASGGVVSAMVLSSILYKKVDLTMVLNGAIGGLVSITAEPLMPSMPLAALIGAMGGVFVVLTVPVLDKIRIDDVVGAIPAHLVCGIWGTLVVPLSNL
ncbi:MAG: ammonium transporter, partial [Pseudomonadota bacterium]